MRSAGAILPEPQGTWEQPAEAGTPNLTVLEAPAFLHETPSQDLTVIPTPVRVRGRTLLARFGPPIVFALTLAGIYWFWPPF